MNHFSRNLDSPINLPFPLKPQISVDLDKKFAFWQKLSAGNPNNKALINYKIQQQIIKMHPEYKLKSLDFMLVCSDRNLGYFFPNISGMVYCSGGAVSGQTLSPETLGFIATIIGIKEVALRTKQDHLKGYLKSLLGFSSEVFTSYLSDPPRAFLSGDDYDLDVKAIFKVIQAGING